MKNAWFCAAIAAAGAVAGAARAALIGPFVPDANTLHLWHLDDSSGPAVDAVGGGLSLTNIDQSAQAANSAGGNTPATANVIFGSGAQSGFTTSANFANNALVPTTVNTGSTNTSPHRPILTGATALDAADADTVPFTFANTTTGAFTWEGFVKFDSSYDPTSTTYRNSGGAGGNYPMEIISGEGDANAHRNWQFRYDQVGAGTSSGPNGTTRPRLEFANLHGISGNQSLAIDLPTAGDNAVNNTDWFHLAVQYNGAENTAGNLSFFWTDVSNPANASLTDPVFLGSLQMTNDLLTAAANNPGFAIGNEVRTGGSGTGEGESFVGSIDEVRMSDVTRYLVPEPASLGVLALAGIIMRRRRIA